MINNYTKRAKVRVILSQVTRVLKCDERCTVEDTNARESRNSRGTSAESTPLLLHERRVGDLSNYICNICKINERRVSRRRIVVTLSRPTQVCVHNRRGQIRGVQMKISHGFPLARVPSKQKKNQMTKRVRVLVTQIHKLRPLFIRFLRHFSFWRSIVTIKGLCMRHAMN